MKANNGISLTSLFYYRKLRPKSVVDVDGPDYCPGNWIVNLLRYFWEVNSIMLTWSTCREKRANMVKFDRWVGCWGFAVWLQCCDYQPFLHFLSNSTNNSPNSICLSYFNKVWLQLCFDIVLHIMNCICLLTISVSSSLNWK